MTDIATNVTDIATNTSGIAGAVMTTGNQNIAGIKTFSSTIVSDLNGNILDSTGNELIIGSATLSAVNEITIANAATTDGPTISATGGDADIDLNINTKGTGVVNTSSDLTVGGNITVAATKTVTVSGAGGKFVGPLQGNILDSTGNELIKGTATTNAVNEITITNAATGDVPTISATGGDADINLNLEAKGTGVVNTSGDLTVGGNITVAATKTVTVSGAGGKFVGPLQGNADTATGLNTTTDGIVKTTNSDGTLSFGAIALNELSDAFHNTSAANLVVGHIPGNISSGTSNSAFSSNGLEDLTSGLYNNAFGSGALANVTTGNGNTAMGHKTMEFLVGGAENTAFGQGAMITLTTGSNNTAVGVSAGTGNQTGSYNTSVGYSALNGTGNNSSNTAVGFQAGHGITTGSDNVFVGKKAGNTIEDGSSNVVIGDDADVFAANSSNQIVIGKGATGVGDNIAVIGNASTEKVYMSEDADAVVYTAGIKTSAGALTLDGAAGVNIASTGVMTTVKGTLNIDEAVTLDTTLDVTGDTNLNSTTTSTSSAAGALIVDGGVGIAENLNVGGAINVTDAATTRNNLGIYSGTLNWDSNGANDGFGGTVADEESTIVLPANIILSASSIVILTIKSNTSGNVAVVQDVVNVVNASGADSITVTLNNTALDDKVTFNFIIIQ